MDKAEKQDSLLEAAVALLQSTPDGALKTTSLNKALFYVDLLALRDCGETLTGNTYIALQQGPVIARYSKRLLTPLGPAGGRFRLKMGWRSP